MATLTLHRDDTTLDALREYRVLLDGVEIGRVARGATLHHEIADGEHVVEARIDWCGSRQHRFDTRAGEDTVLVVRNTLRGVAVLLLLFYAVFRARDYLTIEAQAARVEPR